MRRTSSIVAAIAAALLAAACAKQGGGAAAQPAQAGGYGATCPMAQLRGVHASVTDIDNGAAVTFTGNANDESAIRSEVKKMVGDNDKSGNAFASCACATKEAGEGRASMQPQGAVPLPEVIRADAIKKTVTNGAKLELTAKHRGDVTALRDQVRRDVQALESYCLGGR